MSTYLYLYGLVPTNEAEEVTFQSFYGLDGENHVTQRPIGEVTAITCELSSSEYSEEQLQDKMENDMDWLQEKAMHHHEALLALQNRYTLIPMKFCTIYKSEENLTEKISEKTTNILRLFEKIKGHQEWNLKIYCDDSVLKQHVIDHNLTIKEKQEEISQLSPGRQFFEKKKIDQLIDKELENEKTKVCEQFHEEFKKLSLEETIKRNWNKDVTGRAAEMSWNSVYLLADDQVNDFLARIEEKKASYESYGWTFEASGPWPVYHFTS